MQKWARSLGDPAIHGCCDSLESLFSPRCCPPAHSVTSQRAQGCSTHPGCPYARTLLFKLGVTGTFSTGRDTVEIFHLPPFLKSPAGCAVQGPPNMKHHPSLTRSPETPPNTTALFSCPKQNMLCPPPPLWLVSRHCPSGVPSSLFQLRITVLYIICLR